MYNTWPSSGHDFTCVILLLIILPTLVLGDRRCEEENEAGDYNSLACNYKIASLASILVASAIGVAIPMLGKTISALRLEKDFFFLVKGFAGGVILSTGFIHVLPEAVEKLTTPCLRYHPWGEFPFTGLVAMLSAILALMIDSLATAYFNKSNFDNKDQNVVEEKVDVHGDHLHVDIHATYSHAHGSISSSSAELLRHCVISQALEVGIVVHSVIIGISLGASESPKTMKPLMAALAFHQFFRLLHLTAPVGIAIGIGITNAYNEKNPTALIVEGILNVASVGILIYLSLVDLLIANSINSRVQESSRLQIGAHASLLGAGCMSLLAK